MFAPLYRLLIVKKYLQKGDPNLTFTSCPNRKSTFNIEKNYIGTTTRGKFTIFPPLYRSLIVKNIYTKVTPIWPLLPVQTGSESLTFKTNHISTTTIGKFTIFAPLYRSLFCKKYLQKGDPTLTFVQTGSQCWIFFLKVIPQQPQELNLQFLHHCTDRQLSKNN